MPEYDSITPKKVRNLSRGNNLSVSSATPKANLQDLSGTLTGILQIQSKSDALAANESAARVRNSEDMAALGKMVGVGNFKQPQLQAAIAEQSRLMEKHGVISAMENFSTLDAVDEDRTKARLTTLSAHLTEGGAIQRLSNPDKAHGFQSTFDDELRHSMKSLGGVDFLGEVAVDSQGNPVTLDVNSMTLQEKILFSKSTMLLRSSVEKATGQLMTQRSKEASKQRGQTAAYEAVSNLNKALHHKKLGIGPQRMTPFGPPMHPLSGKAIYTDDEGNQYTEKSITIIVDGKFVNIPSVDTNTGETYKTNDEAYEAAIESGDATYFDTGEEAKAAAVARSRELGDALKPEWVEMQESALLGLRQAYQSMYNANIEDPNKAFLEAISSSLSDLAANTDPTMKTGNGIHDVNTILDLMENDRFSIRLDPEGRPMSFAPAGTANRDLLEAMRASANEVWADKRVALDAAQPDLEDEFMLYAWEQYRTIRKAAKEAEDPNYFLNPVNQSEFMHQLQEVAMEAGIADFSKVRTQIEGIWALAKAPGTTVEMSKAGKDLQIDIYTQSLTPNNPEEVAKLQEQVNNAWREGQISESAFENLSQELQDITAKTRSGDTAKEAKNSAALVSIKRFSRDYIGKQFEGYLKRFSGKILKDDEVMANIDMIDDARMLQVMLTRGSIDGTTIVIPPAFRVRIEKVVADYHGASDKEKKGDKYQVWKRMEGKFGRDMIVEIEAILSPPVLEKAKTPLEMQINSEISSAYLERVIRVGSIIDLYATGIGTAASQGETQAAEELSRIWISLDFQPQSNN